MRSKNGWVLLIMLLSGIVLGGFIGMLCWWWVWATGK